MVAGSIEFNSFDPKHVIILKNSLNNINYQG